MHSKHAPANKVNFHVDHKYIDEVQNSLVGYFMLKPEAERCELPANTRFEDFNPFGLGRMRSGSKLHGSQGLDIEWKSHDSGSVVKTHLEIPAVTRLRLEEEARKPRSYSDSIVVPAQSPVSDMGSLASRPSRSPVWPVQFT